MKSTDNTDKHLEIYGLYKVPDEIIIEDLRKELKQKDFEIGQLKSYVQELEDGLIEKIYIEEDSCCKCDGRKKRIQLLESKLCEANKKIKEFKSIPIDQVESAKKLKKDYYKELAKNERLVSQLIIQAKEIFRLRKSINP